MSINKDNYFKDTRCVFKEIKIDSILQNIFDSMINNNVSIGDRICGYEVNFISISSYYLIKDNKLYRYSNHWGEVASCTWMLETDNQKGGDFRLGVAHLNTFEEKNYFSLQEMIIVSNEPFGTELKLNYPVNKYKTCHYHIGDNSPYNSENIVWCPSTILKKENPYVGLEDLWFSFEVFKNAYGTTILIVNSIFKDINDFICGNDEDSCDYVYDYPAMDAFKAQTDIQLDRNINIFAKINDLEKLQVGDFYDI